jgi:hypothetical protein
MGKLSEYQGVIKDFLLQIFLLMKRIINYIIKQLFATLNLDKDGINVE